MQRRLREFNMPRKKEMLILVCHRLPASLVVRPDNLPAEAPARRHLGSLTHAGGREYHDFMRGGVNSEPEAGDSMPREKRNSLSLRVGTHHAAEKLNSYLKKKGPCLALSTCPVQ